jgi:hypothetical protein
VSDPVVYVLLAASCVAIVIGALKLGGGMDLSLGGLWASPYARPDWPRRVQEADSPHFAVSHADALRRGTPIALTPVGLANDDGPQPEMVEIDDAEPSPVEAVRPGRPGH